MEIFRGKSIKIYCIKKKKTETRIFTLFKNRQREEKPYKDVQLVVDRGRIMSQKRQDGYEMRLEEIIDGILQKVVLPDRLDRTLIKWSIENKVEETFPKFISAIKSEKLQTMEVQSRGGKRIPVKGLEHSRFFILLANSYAEKRLFEKALEVFEGMRRKGSNESTMLNDYGAALLNQMLVDRSVNKKRLDLARKLIFGAYAFDKKVSANWYEYPAYKNLCFLRAIEASYYKEQKDYFATFVLGWMSIEMTIYRIWHQFLTLKSASGIDDLMRWNSDTIMRVLSLAEVDGNLRYTKADLDKLKGMIDGSLRSLRKIRDHLLHGKIDNPTSGQSIQCATTALELVPLFQSVQKDLASDRSVDPVLGKLKKVAPSSIGNQEPLSPSIA